MNISRTRSRSSVYCGWLSGVFAVAGRDGVAENAGITKDGVPGSAAARANMVMYPRTLFISYVSADGLKWCMARCVPEKLADTFRKVGGHLFHLF